MIFIYSGIGTSRDSIEHTRFSFEHIANEAIETIDDRQLIAAEWTNRAKLLIVPGGADIPYVKKLNGKGNEIIRAFVNNGGSYLGICAGGYFGTSFVEFDKGGPLEVVGNRELSFFPGKAIGPILAQYDYQSKKGVRAAEIRFGSEKLTVYFSGGAYFENAASTTGVETLATYDDAIHKNRAAIIQTKIGRGTAILSGVHFEYAPKLLDADDVYLKNIVPVLSDYESKRWRLTSKIAANLGLNLCNQ